jgi:hypothetical protein
MNCIQEANKLSSLLSQKDRTEFYEAFDGANYPNASRKELLMIGGYTYHYAEVTDAYDAFHERFKGLCDESLVVASAVEELSRSVAIHKVRAAAEELMLSKISDHDAVTVLCKTLDGLNGKQQSALLRMIETYVEPLKALDLDSVNKDEILIYADAFESDAEAMDFIDKRIEDLRSIVANVTDVFIQESNVQGRNLAASARRATQNSDWSLVEPADNNIPTIKCSIVGSDVNLENTLILSVKHNRSDLIALNDSFVKNSTFEYRDAGGIEYKKELVKLEPAPKKDEMAMSM